MGIKQKMVLLTLCLILISFVSAIEAELEFEKDTNATLPFTCKDEFTGEVCDTDYLCFLNVNYPNGTILFDNASATRNTNTYELLLHQDNLSVNGFYSYSGFCSNGTDGGNSDDLNFQVTESGRTFNEGQGLAALGILGGAIALAFMFLFLGFKFTGKPETMPLALFFIILGLFLAIYSLQLGLNYSIDILEYEGLSNIQGTMYFSILWLLAGIGIISFVLMSIGFVREFGKGKMMKDYGEGFDPVTQTYV